MALHDAGGAAALRGTDDVDRLRVLDGIEADGVTPEQLSFYASLCAMTLARGHARTGDSIAISAYVGKGSKLDDSIAAFSMSYAEQNRQDYERFQQSIADGRLECAEIG